MIILQKLTWNNFFSYKQGEIDFNKNKVTQIKGLNGSGKSSIILILQEVLYGKNIKGIKKQDIINRQYLKDPLKATLTFKINKDQYKVEYKRAATIQLKLFKNGKDISSHTATKTYKTIESLLGIDFKTFSQLIYQSSNNSLMFLTSSDSIRKQFLIRLFNLEIYTQLYELVKEKAKVQNREIDTLTGKIEIVKSWIEQHSKEPLVEKELIKDIPEEPKNLEDRLIELKTKKADISNLNKKINDNNQYKQLLAKIQLPTTPPEDVTDNINSIKKEISNIEKDILAKKIELGRREKDLQELKSIPDICPKCKQPWPVEKNIEAIEKLEKTIKELNKDIEKLKQGKLAEHNKVLKDLQKVQNQYINYKKQAEEFERLINFIDDSLPENPLFIKELDEEIKALIEEINSTKEKIKALELENEKIKLHNSKVLIIKKQLEEYKTNLNNLEKQQISLNEKLTILNILKKVFSNTGLVSYKIEYLIKDLEYEINNYLSEFSDGRFLLSFTLVKDKLNVEILDNGKQVTIDSLSEGEKGRVNISTLLAIRKLMSQVSKTRLNLLFLDEIMGVLDSFAKEKLIEILMQEQNLNTFIVSHEWQHPLVPTIEVQKIEGISKIYG